MQQDMGIYVANSTSKHAGSALLVVGQREGWMRRALSSAGKCLEKKRQIPQAIHENIDSSAAKILMLPWKENAVTVMNLHLSYSSRTTSAEMS